MKTTTTVTTKKLQLFPIGDKEEVDRVFKYIRNGIYNQHHILNIYMSQLGTLYYSVSGDVESELFKKGMEDILRDTEHAYEELSFKQLGTYIRDLDKAYKSSTKNDLTSQEFKDKKNKLYPVDWTPVF